MDEERSSYKAITLLGSENFADWRLSILSVLLAKDLLDFIDTETIPIGTDSVTTALNKRKSGKCFAALIQSLSPTILSSLPHDCRDPLNPNAPALWDHLKTAYSSAVGSRQAALVQELFRTTVQEGQNPSEVLSRLQSAHSQLVFGGETISDSLLAYAMTLALPESWTTQKQTLWMDSNLSSQKVASAIRAEWQRRVMDGESGAALAAKQWLPNNGQGRTTTTITTTTTKVRRLVNVRYIPISRTPTLSATNKGQSDLISLKGTRQQTPLPPVM